MQKAELSRLAIESMARRWAQLEALQDRLDMKRDLLKDSILRAIQAHGEVAPNARTMRVLRGIAREIQATFPTETTVDAKMVRKFLAAVPAGYGRRLFERSEKFTLRPGAWELAALTLPHLLPRARRFFAVAVQRTDGAPRVKVVRISKAKRGEAKAARRGAWKSGRRAVREV